MADKNRSAKHAGTALAACCSLDAEHPVLMGGSGQAAVTMRIMVSTGADGTMPGAAAVALVMAPEALHLYPLVHVAIPVQ
jgi:hypothetical protein